MLPFSVQYYNMNRIQRARVLGIQFLTPSTYVLKTERRKFTFIPGQCVNIGVPGAAINREYSTYSGIHDTYLEFLIKKIDHGLVSSAIAQLRLGAEITLDGAYGGFIIDQPLKHSRYVFICTGTGIAPFHSYVKSYPWLSYQIIHGVRFKTEEYARADYGKGQYISCLSQDSGGDFSGRVTNYIKKIPLKFDTLYYLCGNKEMINQVYDILRNKKINGSNIFTEVFF